MGITARITWLRRSGERRENAPSRGWRRNSGSLGGVAFISARERKTTALWTPDRGHRSVGPEKRSLILIGRAPPAIVGALLLAGCTTPVQSPPAMSTLATPAQKQCRVMHDQAMVSARGYSAAQAANQLYWDCVTASLK